MASISFTSQMPASSLTPLPPALPSDAHASASAQGSTSATVAGPSHSSTRSIRDIEADISTVGEQLQQAYRELGALNQRHTHAPTQEELRNSAFSGIFQARRSARDHAGTAPCTKAHVIFTDASSGLRKEWHMFARTQGNIEKLDVAATLAATYKNLEAELEKAREQQTRVPFTPFKTSTRPARASLLGMPQEIMNLVLEHIGPRHEHLDTRRFSVESRKSALRALTLTSRDAYNMVVRDLFRARAPFRPFTEVGTQPRASWPGLPNELQNRILELASHDANGAVIEGARENAVKTLASTCRASYNVFQSEMLAKHLIRRATSIDHPHVPLDKRLEEFKAILKKASTGNVDKEILVFVLRNVGARIRALPQENHIEAMDTFHSLVRDLGEPLNRGIYNNLVISLGNLLDDEERGRAFDHIFTLIRDLSGRETSPVLSEMADYLRSWNQGQDQLKYFNRILNMARELDEDNGVPVFVNLAGSLSDLEIEREIKPDCFQTLVEQASRLQATNQAELLSSLPFGNLGHTPHLKKMADQILALSGKLQGTARYTALRRIPDNIILLDVADRYGLYHQIIEQMQGLESDVERADILQNLIREIYSLPGFLQRPFIENICGHIGGLENNARAETLGALVQETVSNAVLHGSAIFNAASAQARELNGEPRTLLLQTLAEHVRFLPPENRLAALRVVHGQALELDDAARNSVFNLLRMNIPYMPQADLLAVQALLPQQNP